MKTKTRIRIFFKLFTIAKMKKGRYLNITVISKELGWYSFMNVMWLIFLETSEDRDYFAEKCLNQQRSQKVIIL